MIDDPQALFQVQAGAAAIGFGSVNQNVALAVGAGNTITGRSGMFVQNPAVTATLPFTIVDLITDPPGVNGTIRRRLSIF